ncbi:phage tail protein I [Escherichia coli]|uniref:phage tail protein I n=1 Tax=Escherichia coli TaxID=562 RepID=UPI00191AF282|nr:phage tail protein I [Escherichia coli]UMT23335.1 phage tail protein I [Escherichia coli]CAD6115267.1 tail protein I [Escherichia coli]
MSDKIRSILPVSASRAERVVDSAAGDMLAEIAVCLIRYVKNPDLCPTELLPWLAREMSVDTWNDTWTETEKRAAIKRAAYIHRHRGTKAALTESLSDSPFRSQIVEWYEQTPPGEPYTFRLNVEQQDLPVLMSDHQDLKHAVLRAKNLRSWFSIHVYGSCRGNGYGYGYVTATEKLKNKIMPLQILLSPDRVQLALGETASVQVTVLPLIADDRSFTVQLADERVADIQVDGDVITLTGRQFGSTTVTVTTANGVIATLPVSTVSVTRVLLRVDSVSRPLFLVDPRETEFTIDYGDGTDSRDYTLSGNSVMTTRTLTPGTELMLTVKNCESITFYKSSTSSNPLLEIIQVCSPRTGMYRFAYGHRTLRKIHAGAFDYLTNVNDFGGAFMGCTALETLPEHLFATCRQVTDFSYLFCDCSSLSAIPDGLFARAGEVVDFRYVFSGCEKLASLPEGLFEGAVKARDFSYAFNNCRMLVTLPPRLFAGAISASDFRYTFNGCRALVSLPDDLFHGLNLASVFYRTFALTGLTHLPDNLFAETRGTNFESVFYSAEKLTLVPRTLFHLPLHDGDARIRLDAAFEFCSGLLTIDAGVFDGIMTKIDSAKRIFRYCTALKAVPSRLFAGAVNCESFNSAFDSCRALTFTGDEVFTGSGIRDAQLIFAYCSSLTTTGERLFADCLSLTSYNGCFSGCPSLSQIGAGMLSGCVSLKTAYYLLTSSGGSNQVTTVPGDVFRGCASLNNISSLFDSCGQLTSIPDELFADCQAIQHAGSAFSGCVQLQRVPADIVTPSTTASGLSSMFRNCEQLEMDINDIFTRNFPPGCNLLSIFTGCKNVTGSKSEFLAKFPSPSDTGNAFYGCDRLTD